MYGGLDLGNMASALRMTGGDPVWLEEMRRRQGLASREPSPVPPEANGALAALGSSYRVPDPGPAEQREPPPNPYEESPAPAPRVEDTPFNPGASNRQLQQEYTTGQNEMLDLKQRQGDIQADALRQHGEAAGELESARREGLARAQQQVDEGRSRQQDFQEQARRRLDTITSMVDHPPDQSRGKVLSIIGTMLSASGANGLASAAGAGLQMLGRSMAGDVEQWQAEIGAQKGAHTALLQQAQTEGANSESAIRVEQGLSDLAFGVYNAAIDRVKVEAGSQEAVRAADELQNGLRAKYVEAQLDINARKAAAAAKKQQGRADDVLWNMPMDALATAIADGSGGKRAQEIYKQRAKNSQDVREGEAKISDLMAGTAKKEREASEGGVGEEVLPGHIATVNLGPADKTALRANAMAINDVIADLGRLREIRKRHDGGTFNADDESEAKGIMGRMSTKLSQMNGAGAPSEGERELFRESLTDPTGFYLRKNPVELYDRMAHDFRNNFNAKLRSIGVVPRSSAGSGLGFERDKSSGAGAGGVASRGVSGGW